MSLDARGLLAKFGWKEGDGLGREKHGIKEAIKPKFQQDTSGLGVDKAATLTAPWWADVFNATAQKINVNTETNVESDDSSDAEEMKKKSKKSKKKSKKITQVQSDADQKESQEEQSETVAEILLKKRKASYGNFVKAAENPEKEDDVEEKDQGEWELKRKKKIRFPIDNEVLKQCEGLTAHKGARHGITMGGKMKRVMQQEMEWKSRK